MINLINFIQTEIDVIQSDSRYQDRSASIFANAPLAIIQETLKARLSTLIEIKDKLAKVDSGEFSLMPKHTGGYYIQDTRNPIGNCMKFWYQSGYGTKHKNFFWCATLEEANEYAGGCDWFNIWYAPYIDTLIESTVDMQHADRDREKTMIAAQQENK